VFTSGDWSTALSQVLLPLIERNRQWLEVLVLRGHNIARNLGVLYTVVHYAQALPCPSPLVGCSALKRLDVGLPGIETAAMVINVEILQRLPSLRRLNLDRCGIGDVGAVVLDRALMAGEFPSLEELGLMYNSFMGIPGVHALQTAVAERDKNEHLPNLEVDYPFSWAPAPAPG